eukprot:CAMPEP_0198700050 /NCGR_PEP_ID=MMETSP1468-20131203/363469_1 /TAXON_ID=1461545 /ORGANISM="Mantoniella sp, Strain CCMP1436" /LENGTH=51 /DNA_ID=CAMNT_0044457811 /DNA_START=315 /DNA_END=467 /DNA_ORIENTATION=+
MASGWILCTGMTVGWLAAGVGLEWEDQRSDHSSSIGAPLGGFRVQGSRFRV